MTSLLNNREKALLVWLLILFVWMLSVKSVRASLWQVVKSASDRRILTVLAAMTAYVGLLVYLLYLGHVWHLSFLSDTMIWFVGIALVSLVNVSTADSTEQVAHYFTSSIVKVLALTAVVQFLVNFYPLNFWVELFLVPIITLFAMFVAFAGGNAEYALVKKVITWFLAVIGFGLLAFSVTELIVNHNTFFTSTTLEKFLVPPLLTLAYIPFLYFLALYGAYDGLFRQGLHNKDSHLRRHAEWKILRACRFNLRKLQRFTDANVFKLLDCETGDEIGNLLSKFNASKGWRSND